MSGGPKETLSDEEIKFALRYVIKDGIASQSMGILTGGAFLVAFAIKLGASNMVNGILAAIGQSAAVGLFPCTCVPNKVAQNKRWSSLSR